MTQPNTPDSFWTRVAKGSPHACWDWTGSCNSTGYGTVSWHGIRCTAHRLAAFLTGMVDSVRAPEDKRANSFVLHKCDNRKCCNPDHFFLGNYSANQFDAYSKGRRDGVKGEKHTNAKLTNSQAKAIRHRYAAGETQVVLAKAYGVSQHAISLIIRGKSYCG